MRHVLIVTATLKRIADFFTVRRAPRDCGRA